MQRAGDAAGGSAPDGSSDWTVCPGCGATVPTIDGPTHRFLSASAGCWSAFGDVLDMEFDDFRDPDCHRLTLDTYAIQHPGPPSRETIQSVVGHLISLYLMIERGLDGTTATRALRRAVARPSVFEWLAPPEDPGPMTILDVRSAATLEEHRQVVRRWAEGVWAAWSRHHSTIRDWTVLP